MVAVLPQGLEAVLARSLGRQKRIVGRGHVGVDADVAHDQGPVKALDGAHGVAHETANLTHDPGGRMSGHPEHVGHPRKIHLGLGQLQDLLGQLGAQVIQGLVDFAEDGEGIFQVANRVKGLERVLEGIDLGAGLSRGVLPEGHPVGERGSAQVTVAGITQRMIGPVDDRVGLGSRKALGTGSPALGGREIGKRGGDVRLARQGLSDPLQNRRQPLWQRERLEVGLVATLRGLGSGRSRLVPERTTSRDERGGSRLRDLHHVVLPFALQAFCLSLTRRLGLLVIRAFPWN